MKEKDKKAIDEYNIIVCVAGVFFILGVVFCILGVILDDVVYRILCLFAGGLFLFTAYSTFRERWNKWK